MRDGRLAQQAQWVLLVLNVSLLGFRRHTVLLVQGPPPRPFPHTSATATLLGNPTLDLRRLCPQAAYSQGCCNYSN